jgi:hypothetical protein
LRAPPVAFSEPDDGDPHYEVVRRFLRADVSGESLSFDEPVPDKVGDKSSYICGDRVDAYLRILLADSGNDLILMTAFGRQETPNPYPERVEAEIDLRFSREEDRTFPNFPENHG